MKTIITTLLLIFSLNVIAQPEPFSVYLRGGNDPNMIISGAYPDRGENNVYGLHNKYGFGIEWENTRLGMDIESFSEIGFTKWTYLYFDYKINPIKNIFLFGGIEASQIKRHHPDYRTSIENYREYTINPLSSKQLYRCRITR